MDFLCSRFIKFPLSPSPTSNKPVTNLPAPLTTFIGREKEQAEIINLITKHRLVTLAGVGGIGKTRVALQVGQKLLNDYPDGIWFIAFDSLSDPTLVPQTVAAVFDVREGPDRPIIEILINVLCQKNALLILDNCEHLLDACLQLIQTLLTNCPNLKVLTTSREVLNMEGEAKYYLPSLSVPINDAASPEKMGESESIRLFTERASLALPSFNLTKENGNMIVEICRRVDGIPLAIELAAARISILSVEEILNQLHDSFSLLARDSRTTLSRHQTLQASLDWSWGLLSEMEQIFLQQLSVFAGGWTLEASQAVCDGDVLSLTNALVKKSLIAVDQRSGRETRYRFHEIVHQYAYEKLIESGLEENIRTQHLRYYVRFSELAELALIGPAQIEWMARLIDERDNIRAALAWADKTDVEGGLYISGRLERLWESFDVHEGNYWLSTFLQKPESRACPRARARALHTHISVLNYLSQVDQSQLSAKGCRELYRTLSDQRGEADIAPIEVEGVHSAAQRIEVFQSALRLAQASGDIWWQARMLLRLGWNSSRDERLAYWARAIILFRQVGDWHYLANVLSSAGNAALLNGNLELAQNYLDEATLLNDQLKDKEAKAMLLYARGQVAMRRGDYEQAYNDLQEELDLTEELGARMHSFWCRTHLGYLALREGNLTKAQDIFAKTASVFFNDRNEIGVVFNIEGIAGIYIATGKPKLAARLIGWSDSIRERINDTRPVIEQADVDKIIAACIAQIGEVAFSDAYEDGQKMTIDEAVALAMKEN